MKNYYNSKVFEAITKKMLLLIFVVPAIVAFISCEKSDVNEPNLLKIQFWAKSTKLNATESQISEIEALVFVKNGTDYVYTYSYSASSLANIGNNTVSFRVDIVADARPAKVYIVTNSKNAIASSDLQFGDNELTVKQKLKYEYPTQGITTNFPMWGEYDFPSGLSADMGSSVINLSVLPAIARVDVGTNLNPDFFNITSVQGYRVNNAIQIIPTSYTGNLVIIAPSVPANSVGINTNVIAVEGNLLQQKMYLPESITRSAADLLSKGTCLIVGGKYKNSTKDTYYRLDFEPPVANYPTGQILRNHLYTFQIDTVYSQGWETPDEAANNATTNIKADVQDWEDMSMDIDFGGNYFVNVSARTIELADTAKAVGNSLIFTNVFDYKLQWSDASGALIGNEDDVIQNANFKVTALRHVIVVDALQANTGAATVREEYFLIVARRAHILIKIVQNK